MINLQTTESGGQELNLMEVSTHPLVSQLRAALAEVVTQQERDSTMRTDVAEINQEIDMQEFLSH